MAKQRAGRGTGPGEASLLVTGPSLQTAGCHSETDLKQPFFVLAATFPQTSLD